MLILLATLLIKLLIGVPESPFIIPKSEKVIIRQIEDEERKKEAKQAMKAFMKEWKKKQKLQKKENKETVKLIMDAQSDTTTLRARVDAMKAELRNANEALADLRIQVLELVTEEEWQQVLEKISLEKPRKAKKRTKRELKAQLKQQERFRKFRSDLSESFERSGVESRYLAALDGFEQDLSDLLFESQTRAQRVLEVMRDKSSTREEILSITSGYEQLKERSSDAILDFRNELLQLSDEERWTDVSKDLAEFLSY